MAPVVTSFRDEVFHVNVRKDDALIWVVIYGVSIMHVYNPLSLFVLIVPGMMATLMCSTESHLSALQSLVRD